MLSVALEGVVGEPSSLFYKMPCGALGTYTWAAPQGKLEWVPTGQREEKHQCE